MVLDLIWALPVAALVGIVPGWFWAKVLSASADFYVHLTYAIALSLALVPALALIPTQLLGSGVTLGVAVASPLLVFLGGLAAYLRFGPTKAPDSFFVVVPTRPGSLTLLMVVVALTLVLVGDLVSWPLFWLASSCWGWPSVACVSSGGAQRFMVPVALLLLTAGLAHRFTSSRELVALTVPPDPGSPGRQGSPMAVLGRRLALPAVLLLVLLRGYLGPALYDWPFIRGVDHYSYTVMANLMMSEGKIEPYLIYPPGFHTMTAEVSRLSGLDPLKIFPVLGPALLLLPALSCYVLGSRLWGREYGVVAAFSCGVLVGGTYHYFNDAMYPNLVASQFLLVLSIAALVGVYSSPSVRGGLLLAVLGSSVVLYHQVSSLYLALLLALVAPCLLPYLLARERRTGLVLLGSLALLCALSALYAWDTYDLPQVVGGLLGGSEASPTRAAVNMTIGTQVPYAHRLPYRGDRLAARCVVGSPGSGATGGRQGVPGQQAASVGVFHLAGLGGADVRRKPHPNQRLPAALRARSRRAVGGACGLRSGHHPEGLVSTAKAGNRSRGLSGGGSGGLVDRPPCGAKLRAGRRNESPAHDDAADRRRRGVAEGAQRRRKHHGQLPHRPCPKPHDARHGSILGPTLLPSPHD